LTFIALRAGRTGFCLAFDYPGKLSWLALLISLVWFWGSGAFSFLELLIVGARLNTLKRHQGEQ